MFPVRFTDQVTDSFVNFEHAAGLEILQRRHPVPRRVFVHLRADLANLLDRGGFRQGGHTVDR